MTNQLIKKINLNHSFIFFLLINLFSVVMFKFNYLDISSTICLFLILTIGVSHGALDNIKGKKLLKIFNFEGIYIFYIIYIFIALIVIFIWLLFPAATLLIFLSVAAFHFGKEDTQFLINKKSYIIQLLYLLKGLLIILAPLFFHFDDTVKIFKSLLIVNENFYLFLEFLEEKKIIEIAIILSSLSSIFLFLDKFELKKFTIFF
jgi:beta-carotene 15,15''-monooxygenase, Brp/Blh family